MAKISRKTATATETTTEETANNEAGEAAKPAAAPKPVRHEADFAADDPARGEFNVALVAMPGSAAFLNFGANPVTIGVVRLSHGAYVAVWQGVSGSLRSLVKGNAASAIKDALAGSGFGAAQWAIPDASAIEIEEIGASEKPAKAKVATETEVDIFDPASGNNEAVAASADIADQLAQADAALESGEKSVLTGWLLAAKAWKACDAMFKTFYPDADEKAIATRRARWLTGHVAVNYPAMFARLTSKNTPSQLRFMSAFDADTVRSVGANTPSMFEQKTNTIRRDWATIVVEKLFASFCAESVGNGVEYTGDLAGWEAFGDWTGQEDVDVPALGQAIVSKLVAAHNEQTAEYERREAKDAANGMPLAVRPGVWFSDHAALPFLGAFVAARADLFKGDLSRAYAAIVDKLKKADEKKAQSDAASEESESKAGNAFAEMSVDEAAAHLFGILRAHPYQREVLDALAELLDEADDDEAEAEADEADEE